MDVIELELRCTTAQPFTANVLSQSGSKFDSRATKTKSSGILSGGARAHECVAAGASLRPGEELSWQSVTWLFSPVCLSVCQIRGPSWTGPLTVPCPELRACRFLSPLAAWLWCSLYSTVWDDSSVMAMSTVNDFTLHMRCWLGSPCLSSIDPLLQPFVAC